jgi:hypothetical protein
MWARIGATPSARIWRTSRLTSSSITNCCASCITSPASCSSGDCVQRPGSFAPQRTAAIAEHVLVLGAQVAEQRIGLDLGHRGSVLIGHRDLNDRSAILVIATFSSSG